MSEKILKFPDGFLWGSATSSHQVEGGNCNNWSEWEKENADRLAQEAKFYWQPWQREKFPEILTPENYISGKACDHYHRFKEDFKLAKELGHNAHRFSIEWSRIEPQEGKFNQEEINHYKEAVKALRNLDIEPFVTLWHWTIPLWLCNQGEFQSEKISYYFARYTEKIVSALKDQINFWITLNEPEIYASNCYYKGVWPPQRKSLNLYLRMTKNLIGIHKESFRIIKRIQPEAQVGIAKNNIYFEAFKNKMANRLLKKSADWWWNSYFLNQIKNHQDFIGLNYYFHNQINYGFNKNENKEVSDLGWELYPEGIYYVLKDLKKYNKPIYITENGLADKEDEKRKWFIRETLKSMHRAISEGINVKGYLHWSLLDNFEWNRGFWPRFGLIEIDYKTLARKPRPSAYFYRDICKTNQLLHSDSVAG